MRYRDRKTKSVRYKDRKIGRDMERLTESKNEYVIATLTERDRERLRKTGRYRETKKDI